jgi:hypothetical protein
MKIEPPDHRHDYRGCKEYLAVNRVERYTHCPRRESGASLEEPTVQVIHVNIWEIQTRERAESIDSGVLHPVQAAIVPGCRTRSEVRVHIG